MTVIDCNSDALEMVNLLKPLPTCGEMLLRTNVSVIALCEPLWFAAGAYCTAEMSCHSLCVTMQLALNFGPFCNKLTRWPLS